MTDADVIRRRDALRLVEAAAWLSAAGVIVFLLALAPAWSSALTIALSLLPIAYAVRVFIAHGGMQVTALGLFNGSLAMFVGYAGYTYAQQPKNILDVSSERVFLALCLSFAIQVAITTWAWRSETNESDATLAISGIRWLVPVSLTVLTVLYALKLLHVSAIDPSFSESTAFAAIVLLAIGAWFQIGRKPIAPATVMVAGCVAAYAVLFHSGQGRLRLVALVCTLAVLFTARFPHRAWKWIMAAASPVAVWWLAQERLALQEQLVAGASAGRTGLESMTSPLPTLAEVIDYVTSGGELAYGATFLTLPLALLPELLTTGWAPIAIGYELVRITAPSRFGSGYSVASTYLGEWLFNFGLLGALAAIPFVVMGMRFLDRRFHGSVAGLSGAKSAIRLAFWAMLCGSIADYTWSGLHTFGARALTRLPLLIVIYLIARQVDKHHTLRAQRSEHRTVRDYRQRVDRRVDSLRA